MNRFLILLFFIVYANTVSGQPGSLPAALHFIVVNNSGNVIVNGQSDFMLEWRPQMNIASQWQKAATQNGEFVTGKISLRGGAVAIKIYCSGCLDTMFINTTQSLTNIPFQPGAFVLNRNTAPLANMQVFNPVHIINQDWKYFRIEKQEHLPVLKKHRYVYMPKELWPEEEVAGDNELFYEGFNQSEHIKVTGEDEYENYMELGKLYYAPALSSSVYLIGYLNDLDKEQIDYRPYLLESTNGCKSWKILFAMQEGDEQLVNITANGFVFLREHVQASFITYNSFGKIVDSVIATEPCSMQQNVFAVCERYTKVASLSGIEMSDPLMSGDALRHVFHRRFSDDGTRFISLNELPFHPNIISRYSGSTEEKIIALNAADTYAYLTMRKNKLVLLAYNYTLVSLDFGNTWLYYRNGLLEGGNWNFIWLDDNTLVNVTQEYADVMMIENVVR